MIFAEKIKQLREGLQTPQRIWASAGEIDTPAIGTEKEPAPQAFKVALQKAKKK